MIVHVAAVAVEAEDVSSGPDSSVASRDSSSASGVPQGNVSPPHSQSDAESGNYYFIIIIIIGS
jgi:hypothetical protein